jgi:steroid delta-isomerase-like uncharacterized protein
MDLVRSFYTAVELGDEALLRRLLSPDWVEVPAVYPGQPAGPDGYLPIVHAFRAAFPDVRFEIHELLPSGEKVTVRTTIHGTHRGEWLGVAAAGRTIAVDTIDIHEVAAGQLVRSWHIEDWFTGLKQMRGEP